MSRPFAAKPRILLVEDERDIAKLVKYNLEKEGYEVLTAADGLSGLAMARDEKPNLILLDLMLPQLDGLGVCRDLRKESNVPIIMVTAKKGELDRILGLELGADDYVNKPFSVRELMARVKTILRRTHATEIPAGALRFGDLHVDLARYTVSVRNKPVALSAKEFEFLKVLVQAQGKALSREVLLEQVWGL